MPRARRAPATSRAMPRWVEPMLATLIPAQALPEGWDYEPKLDGYRCLAVRQHGRVTLRSRNRLSLDDAFPEIRAALERQLQGDAIVDGEIVAVDPATGVPSFSRLQLRGGLRDARRATARGVTVEYWAFDCCWAEGHDLRQVPLTTRRAALARVLREGHGIRRTPTFDGPFAVLFREVCRRGGEGLIGKRTAGPYRAGRSHDWVKLKCVRAQEFVVGGWTAPQGTRAHLGALLVGYYDAHGALHFAGKVGTGYTQASLATLAQRLRPLGRRTSPFAEPVPARGAAGVHWVRPALVVQIGFSEWTADGRLRHPRFEGLREDKPAVAVTREMPARRPISRARR